MTIATFAIAGFPPLAGFFSKDEILAQTFSKYPVLWGLGVITAGLTSFYMFRLWFMTFYGEYKPDVVLGDARVAQAPGSPTRASRGGVEVPSPVSHGAQPPSAASHSHGGVHESPWVMMGPLVVLAIGSIVAGWVGVPEFMGGHNRFEHLLSPVMQQPGERMTVNFRLLSKEESRELEQMEHAYVTREWTLAGTSVAVAALGLFFAWLLYYKRPDLPDRITAKIHGVYITVLHKYYVDEGYSALFVKPLLALSTVVFWKGIDQGVIDGLVNGAGETSKNIGNELRRMQSGNIRSYAAWVALGGAAVIVYMVWLGVHR